MITVVASFAAGSSKKMSNQPAGNTPTETSPPNDREHVHEHEHEHEHEPEHEPEYEPEHEPEHEHEYEHEYEHEVGAESTTISQRDGNSPDNNAHNYTIILNMNLKKKTREEYHRKFKRYLNWLRVKHPDQLTSDGQLNVEQFSVDVFLQFLHDVYRSGGKLSVLEQFRAALKNHFRERRAKFKDSDNIVLVQYINGVKKTIAAKRRDGETASMSTGKLPMPFDLYVALAHTMLIRFDPSHPQYLFAHPYMILTWNLMARSNNVASLLYTHVTVEADALVIRLPQQKNDQTGERASGPRHLYANPIRPSICPILSLGIYMLGKVNITNQVFNSQDPTTQVTRFGAILRRLMEGPLYGDDGTETSCESHGRKPEFLGSHSIRKGAATYAASGTTEGPNSITVINRGGWKVGGATDTYFQTGVAGDQMLGRFLSGLPYKSADFGALPPHFVGMSMRESNEILAAAVPGVAEEHPHIRPIALRCIASVVHHLDWLQEHLPNSHPLWMNQFIASGYAERIKNRVVCGRISPSISATGVPNSAIIYEKFDEQRERLEKIQEMLENGAGGAGGAAPCNLVMEQLQELRDLVVQQLDRSNRNGGALNGAEGYPVYTHAGTVIRIPAGYKLPTVVVSAGWMMWWEGLLKDGIPPIRLLCPHDFTNILERKKFCEWKKVFQTIEKLAKQEQPALYDRLSTTDCPSNRLADVTTLYQRIKHRLPFPTISSKGRKRKPEDDKVRTLYKRIKTIDCLLDG